jgi:hypothetical protein
MIEINKIELNPLPPPIRVLNADNLLLKKKNEELINMLLIGGLIIGIIMAEKIITIIKQKDERKKELRVLNHRGKNNY